MARRPNPGENLSERAPLTRLDDVFVVDLRRCIGCHACSVACKTAHDVPLGEFPLRVRWLPRPDGQTFAFLPVFSESRCGGTGPGVGARQRGRRGSSHAARDPAAPGPGSDGLEKQRHVHRPFRVRKSAAAPRRRPRSARPRSDLRAEVAAWVSNDASSSASPRASPPAWRHRPGWLARPKAGPAQGQRGHAGQSTINAHRRSPRSASAAPPTAASSGGCRTAASA